MRQLAPYFPSLKKLVRRLGLVLFGLLLGWLLLELVLRAAFPYLPYVFQASLRNIYVTPFTDQRILPAAVVQADSDYQTVTRAGVDNELQHLVPSVPMHITTLNWLDSNSHVGFRVPSLDWEPRWPVDAVFVGDSHTFCFTEYEDCWVYLLEKKHDLSTVNLAQGATGSISHLRILQKFGLLYEPRFVVWQWYGNDFNEDYGMATTFLGLEPVEPPKDEPATSPPSVMAEWLSQHSALYGIIQTVRSSETERYKYNRFVDPYQLKTESLEMGFGRDSTISGFDMSDPKQQIGLKLTQESILAAGEMLLERERPLIIILLPAKEEVYAKWVEPILGEETMRAIREGRELMNDFCVEEELICLDVTDEFVAAANAGVQLFYDDDNHLNIEGNRLLAEIVWLFLEEEVINVDW